MKKLLIILVGLVILVCSGISYANSITYNDDIGPINSVDWNNSTSSTSSSSWWFSFFSQDSLY